MAKTQQRPLRRQRPPRTRKGRKRGRTSAAGWGAGVVVLIGIAAFLALQRGGDEKGSLASPFVGGDLHSLVVDPADDSRLYVGGHEGVAVSTNGGSTWEQIESLDGADAMGWAFTDDAVLVGGHPGLFVSSDGGRTFVGDNDGLPATDIHALGAGEGVVYAASPAAGVIASTDGGRTWELRTDQAGQGFMGRILVDPQDAQHIVAPDMQFGAVVSTDGGRTWRGLGGVQGAMWVSWDLDRTDHLVVSGMGQAAETTDGGRSWRPVSVPEGASVIELSPSQPEVLFAGVLDGTDAVVWVSRDGGATWERP